MKRRRFPISVRQRDMTLIDFMTGVLVASLVLLAFVLVLSLDRAF